ncbi:E3 SUMO-protein ligase RanBP2-like isoform X2 [Ciona intestinalis]
MFPGAEVKSLPKLPDLALTPLVKQHQKDKERIQSETSPPTEEKQDDKGNVEVTKGRTRNTSISLSKFEFNMKVDPTMPEHGSHKTRNISVCSATSTEEADIHVEPIVPLPDKVDVPTGEEQDQVLFENRVKLFVFHRESKQWKERGLGKVRILQNLNNYRIRLVMRREQVFKVCLNHFITEAIHFNFKENSDKVLVWAATDFSDPDKPNGEMLQFAMKLKSAETAINFLNTVQDGNEAFSAKRLLDPVSILEDKSEINTSVQDASNASQQSENGNTSVHKSPVKSTKPAFSFANVATPFGNKSKPLFSDIVFGTPKTQPAAPATKFTFDASSISFNFGSTSTPATSAPAFQIAPAVMQKPAASKSLFGVVQPSTGNSDASQQKEQNTMFGQHSSNFQFGMATAGNDQNGVETNVGENEIEKNEKDSKPVELVKTDTNDVEEKDSEIDDDVIFVWEAVPTQSQLERSRKLQLPPCFFMYEDNTDLEDVDSEEEDAILEYMRLRDDPENEITDEEYRKSLSLREDTPPPEIAESDKEESPSLEENEGEQEREEEEQKSENQELKEQSQIGGNLFGNYTKPDFSFASMASAVDNKNAFGARKDAAFTVTAAQSMLFTGASQSPDADPEAFNPDYKPVVAELPPLIEMKTGEEGEEILFKERCKMFRFDNSISNWKERGLGELKVLFHKEMNLHRVVMRREQVLKVCANHLITKDMNLLPNSDKSWMYVANNKSG